LAGTSCARRRAAHARTLAPRAARAAGSGAQALTRSGAQVTAEFLAFSKARGNDLMTPRPEFSFPGLVPGSRWCLCASRWAEALRAGCAPPVVLSACAEAALRFVTLEELQAHAVPE
jgi:uncharacterized protein (DUF2237 family)